MNLTEMRDVVSEVSFPEYKFGVYESTKGYTYLQAWYDEADTVTGLMAVQYTRRWMLTPEMSKSEIVSTAFKCALTSMEHKTREWFLYRGAAIYQPHYNFDDLLSICEKREVRP
jgi:TRAP-type mannitol/chloroaromatic compound transport system substrate-binding protein